MVRYVAFLVLGSAFVTGIVTTVQTHRLFASTPVNYVDGHWPSSVLTTPMRSVSRLEFRPAKRETN
jgi:hypothetical protein